MWWVKLSILEAQAVLDDISTEESADGSYEIINEAIKNAVWEEVPSEQIECGDLVPEGN